MSNRDTRVVLLRDLDAVDDPMSAMAFQERLATVLREAEQSPDPEDREQRHLIRLMGDALAEKVLSGHALRELARDGRHPSSLTDQGDAFDFVIDVAKHFAEGGLFPIVADLTNLIGVGDIVVVAGPDILSIIECKNTTPPPEFRLRGRHWRQQQRSNSAASYLTDGRVAESDGTIRVAFDRDEAEPQLEALTQCINLARTDSRRLGISYLADRDILIALWDPVGEPSDYMPSIDNSDWKFPLWAMSGQAIANPGVFMFNPYSLPLSDEARTAIAEGELLLVRLVDLSLLEVGDPSAHQNHVQVYRKYGEYQLKLIVDGRELDLSRRFVDQILWDFRSLEDTRSVLAAMLEMAPHLTSSPPATTVASAEARTMAAFAYRNPDGTPEPLIVSQLGQLVNLGVSVPWDELITAAEENSSFPAKIAVNPNGLNLIVEITTPESDSSA